MARTVPGALGKGLGWPSPSSTPGLSRRAEPEWHHHGATWPFRHTLPNTGSFRISAPSVGAPGQPVKDPQFTPVRHRLSALLTMPVFSVCARTHMHAHTYAHTHTVQACVF